MTPVQPSNITLKLIILSIILLCSSLVIFASNNNFNNLPKSTTPSNSNSNHNVALEDDISSSDNIQEEEKSDFIPPESSIPQPKIQYIVDDIWDNIQWFSDQYDTNSASKRYIWARPIFNSWIDLTQLWERIDKLSFYVSPKDTSKQSKCNLTNYNIALNTIDKRLLNPWESYNANQELIKAKGYCTWRWETNFLFYGWVCGMTSQLFRSSLINPSISITKRSNHNQRFVQYYGEDVQWDDAAIYQMNKQFEIQNASDQPIYFRTISSWNMTYIISITRSTDQRVDISKNYLHARWVDLTRQIWKNLNSTSGELISTETFRSVYTAKNYELR